MAKEKNTGTESRQSVKMTLAHYDMNADQMRIKYRVIEKLQPYFEGIPLRKREDISEISMSDLDYVKVAVDIASCAAPGTNCQYSYIRKIAKQMTDITMEYENPEYDYVAAKIFPDVSKRRGESILDITVNKHFLYCLLAQGCWQTFYDTNLICSFDSQYSMRMYELVARQSETVPQKFTFEELKSLFGLKDKYTDEKYGVSNFEKKVLAVAKAELDERCPWSFNYSRKRNAEGKWEFSIFAVRHLENESDEQRSRKRKQLAISVCIPETAKTVLRSEKGGYGFTSKEISNNLDVFLDYQKIPGANLTVDIVKLYDVAMEKDNPKGYLIGVLKARIAESLGE